MKLGDLFVKLGLKSQEFESGMKKAGGSVNTFGGIVKKIGPMIAAAFSVAAVYNFFKSSLSLAAEQIKVENELAAALRANGKEVDNNLRRYKTFASQMQRVTTIGDETTLGLLRLAESMQSKAPEEAAKMAIGLSKALGMDLQTATRAAVLAQNGNFMALSRYIPALREATSEVDKFAAVQKTVASGMQIAFAETNTAKGKLEQLKGAWNDLKEVIATGFLNSESIKTDLESWTKVIRIWQSDQISGWQKFYSSISKSAMEANIAIVDSLVGPERNWREQDARLRQASANNTKHAKTIKELTEDTNNLKNSLGDYTVEQGKEIQNTLRQIKANEELIKKLTTLTEVTKRLNNVPALPQRFGAGTITEGAGRETTYKDGLRSTVTVAAPPIDTKQLADLTAFIQSNKDKVKQMQDEMALDWASFNAQMSNLIVDFSLDVVEQFASSLGELFATGEWNGKAFGLGILDSIGKFLSTFGSMLIALGVGSEAFQTMIKSGFLANPFAAIAAGAALVALGSGISAYGRSRARGGGGGASAAAPAPGMFNQAANVNPAFAGSGTMGSVFLRGDDLYISGQRNDFKRGQIG